MHTVEGGGVIVSNMFAKGKNLLEHTLEGGRVIVSNLFAKSKNLLEERRGSLQPACRRSYTLFGLDPDLGELRSSWS